jgi:hypothetical protein
MKKMMVSLALVLALCLVLAIPASAGSLGDQNWQLDSEQITEGVYQMEKTGGPGDDGQGSSSPEPNVEFLNILPDESNSIVWISDQESEGVTFPAGDYWIMRLATDITWNQGTFKKCLAEIGQWSSNGGFEPLTGAFIPVAYNSVSGSTTAKILEWNFQMTDITIEQYKYLALRITNKDTLTHKIYTGEKDQASCINSPQSDPGYPTPEIAAGVLFGLGLAGVGTFIMVRKKKGKASSAR